mmetsp:Transcript_6241/g.8839  ORF Transcript_6241/g.8839 Transcript_6241/m.8839 type:complete len:84 (-) Transcript_6241:185-436(-)
MWLRRGGIRCPLCNREVKMHEKESFDDYQSEIRTTQGQAGTLQSSRADSQSLTAFRNSLATDETLTATGENVHLSCVEESAQI